MAKKSKAASTDIPLVTKGKRPSLRNAELANLVITRANAFPKLRFAPSSIARADWGDDGWVITFKTIDFLEVVENGILSSFFIVQRSGFLEG